MKAVVEKLPAEDKGELLIQKWLFLSRAFFIVKLKFEKSNKILSQIIIDRFFIHIYFRLLPLERLLIQKISARFLWILNKNFSSRFPWIILCHFPLKSAKFKSD